MLVAVVGPSGAGKDSILRQAQRLLAHDKRFHFVRRVISRPFDRHEDHEACTAEAFIARHKAHEFCLIWQAHGLHYGLPASVLAKSKAGTIAIANISRSSIDEARAAFPEVKVIAITATPAVLAERLSKRGRETSTDISARLSRQVLCHADATIDNSRDLDSAAYDFLEALERFA